MQTVLFFEHIGEALGVEAHWCRYEWQSRGSTHAHYFLWLKGAPDVSFLNNWVDEALLNLGDGVSLTDEVVEELVRKLNDRATAASGWCPQGGWESVEAPDGSLDESKLLDAVQGAWINQNGTLFDGDVVPEEFKAAHAADWWERRCGRFNQAWDEHEGKPHSSGDINSHPSSKSHVSVPAGTPANAPLCDVITDDRAKLLNRNNRHLRCSASYCLRRDKHGKEFCRFGFPLQPRELNSTHFYFDVVRNKGGSAKGVRAQLYFKMNDPYMNVTNPEQLSSQRSNVDFKPIVDHYSAVEYATKYATKKEKGSKAFDTLVAHALNSGGRAEAEAAGRSPIGALASFLIQTTGGRDWSAQEVAHVNMGMPTVIASHEFRAYSVRNASKLKDVIEEGASDEAVVDTKNKFDDYLSRLCAHNLANHGGGVQTSLAQFGVAAPGVDVIDRDEIARCSFCEFWRQYEFKSGGRSNGHQIVRRTTPTVVTVGPYFHSDCAKPGHAKRKQYCEVMLRKHMAFESEGDYKDYIFREHGGDFEAAYEAFATLDPAAPEVPVFAL